MAISRMLGHLSPVIPSFSQSILYIYKHHLTWVTKLFRGKFWREPLNSILEPLDHFYICGKYCISIKKIKNKKRLTSYRPCNSRQTSHRALYPEGLRFCDSLPESEVWCETTNHTRGLDVVRKGIYRAVWRLTVQWFFDHPSKFSGLTKTRVHRATYLATESFRRPSSVQLR